MQIKLNTIYRLANCRLGTVKLDGSKTVLYTSDTKMLNLVADMGKYALVSEVGPSETYFLNDMQILSHLASRDKRSLDDQVVTWDGLALRLPTETELKATIQYRYNAISRYPTFLLGDYHKALAQGLQPLKPEPQS